MRRRLAAALAAAFSFAACEQEDALPTFEVTSFAFGDGETMPERHTCEGDDLSPPLVFDGAPEDTAGYAVLMIEIGLEGEDDVVRWALWGIAADAARVGEGIPVGISPGGGLSQGRNALDAFGYSGPCPGENGEEDTKTHHYVFRAYALSAPIELEPGTSVPHVVDAISALAVARGEVVGVY
jgi:Raf kinase inhibitor-like YbhB/YbcL family protein